MTRTRGYLPTEAPGQQYAGGRARGTSGSEETVEIRQNLARTGLRMVHRGARPPGAGAPTCSGSCVGSPPACAGVDPACGLGAGSSSAGARVGPACCDAGTWPRAGRVWPEAWPHLVGRMSAGALRLRTDGVGAPGDGRRGRKFKRFVWTINQAADVSRETLAGEGRSNRVFRNCVGSALRLTRPTSDPTYAQVSTPVGLPASQASMAETIPA
jgi:hypothetical protein